MSIFPAEIESFERKIKTDTVIEGAPFHTWETSVVMEPAPTVVSVKRFFPSIEQRAIVGETKWCSGVPVYQFSKTTTSLDLGDADGGIIKVDVPYEAVKLLAEQSLQTGKIINLKKNNWESLSRQYESKTGPFAPEMPPQSRGPG